MKKKPVNYIDKEKLYDELLAYSLAFKQAKLEGRPRPVMSDSLGRSIIKIATNVASRSNFYGYSYKDEMIGDAIENCVSYAHNFNPEKSTNAFAYLTQICWYALTHRIGTEKLKQETKVELIRNSTSIDSMSYSTIAGDYNNYGNIHMDFLLEQIDDRTKDSESDKNMKSASVKLDKETKRVLAEKEEQIEKLAADIEEKPIEDEDDTDDYTLDSVISSNKFMETEDE